MSKMTESMAKVTNTITVEIINYPGALQSAVHGMQEFLLLANKQTTPESSRFVPIVSEVSEVSGVAQLNTIDTDIVVLPPNLEGEYFLDPDEALLDYLRPRTAKAR